MAAAIHSSIAFAQQTTDPGRVDERLRARPDVPPVGAIDLPEVQFQAAVPDSGLSVTLTAVRFEGASAVPPEALEALAAPYLGREMPLSEVFRLAEEVTAEYRRRGFVLSRAIVGPQRIEGGVLTIQIVEGFIDRTTIEGKAGGYRPFLDAYLAPVRGGRPTTGDDLARALLLARDLEGVEVRAVLAPSPDIAGAADLSLVVNRRPLEGFVAFDNRGSRWLGPLQIYGGMVLNDLLGGGERLAITGVAAPDHGGELGFLSTTYDQPIGGSGLRAGTFVSYVRTRPGGELRALGLEGKSLTGGATLQYPLIRSRDANLLGRLTFTVRDSQSFNLALDPIFRDKTRTLSAEAIANQATPWGAHLTLRLSITRGLDVLGATEAADPAKSRATASGQFTRVNVETEWVQRLYGGLHLLLGGAAQASHDSLLASEEFGLGGTQFGRAFDPSEITGDEGFAGKVELFYTHPAFRSGAVEPFVYYEGGQVQQNDALPGEALRASLESLGAGVRLSFAGGVAASIEYAKPFDRDVAANGDRDGRAFVSFSAAY
ncbi:ShlB/FhaC/HecB family hemolysin secretion/activation protein [Croceibacterium aestuarii]|uniref:ShlB/FhaC/HecB family hemolysin secretion/activation protein n=1 Tax=Croceibacterium aestuarii TaxID=3064139 RepID=UPI00272DEA05|nr:ShlB/FhaC/HecB family hemolysin secretion/activation protein [Croceibacterium sp. D39]